MGKEGYPQLEGAIEGDSVHEKLIQEADRETPTFSRWTPQPPAEECSPGYHDAHP